MKTVVIATNNAHKAAEIRTALNFEGWEFKTLRDLGLQSDPEESAGTFEGNSRIKVRAAQEAARKALGRPVAVLADDSGLEVDALDGAPGVYSARYAGPDGDDAANNAKLLAELASVGPENRTARFVCTLVFIDEDGAETVARGTIEGAIGFEERGSEGFGYDPLFYVEKYGCTFGELPAEVKNTISHRANALNKLKAILKDKVN